MSKKSKMKEREEASYIAPCEDVLLTKTIYKQL